MYVFIYLQHKKIWVDKVSKTNPKIASTRV